MNAHDLPDVNPLMVRRFTPLSLWTLVGGVVVMVDYAVEDVGLADGRLAFDEDIVDCSCRIFDLTTRMMFMTPPLAFTVFPSRRWRCFREGSEITDVPDALKPLLYIGNPIRLFSGAEGIRVVHTREFRIKSGMELGF